MTHEATPLKCDLCSNAVTDSDNLLRLRGTVIHYQCWLNACKLTGTNPIITVDHLGSNVNRPSVFKRLMLLTGAMTLAGVLMTVGHRYFKLKM